MLGLGLRRQSCLRSCDRLRHLLRHLLRDRLRKGRNFYTTGVLAVLTHLS